MVGAGVVLSNPVAGNHSAQAVRVRTVGERMDHLVLLDVAQRVHVFGCHRWDVPGRTEQDDTGLLRQWFRGVVDEYARVIVRGSIWRGEKG